MTANRTRPRLDAELVLPATLLSRYLFFLERRPVSAANAHYRSSRIAALQSLAPLFDDERIAAPLRALTPSNLSLLAPELQRSVQPLLAWSTPRDLVATNDPPASAFWHDAQRLLVIYGPAIGIGDEIITSTLPRALRELAPHASIEVLTAYDGLWPRIAPEETARTYRDLSNLLTRLRGDGADSIVYVDFEPPGLVNAMAHESHARRFIELSLGTRSLTLLDHAARRLHQLPAARAVPRQLLPRPRPHALLARRENPGDSCDACRQSAFSPPQRGEGAEGG